MRISPTNIHLLAMGVLIACACLFFSCASPKPSSGTAYSEYSPTISADGRTMVFQADIDEPKRYKIYSKTKIFDTWSRPIALDRINSAYNDGGCFITYDQNYLIFTSDRPGGLGNCDLWISQRNGDDWSEPANMGAPINSASYEGFASLAPDGNTLYFVRECPEKTSCKDHLGLFYAEKVNGAWQAPKKMPSPINSDYCEFGPIILADNISLIFSSTRPGGFGGYDLYKSERSEDGTWSEPMNLGSFINTKGEDSLVAIPASGDIMYYTRPLEGSESRRGEGIRRIVSVPIPEELQQSKVVIVRGTVRDKRNTAKTLFAHITLTDIQNDDRPIVINSNKQDGAYLVILNKGKTFDFAVKSKGYLFASKRINLTNLQSFKEINEDILLEPLVKGAGIVLHNMYFEFKSYKLLPESKYELNRIIEIMRENPTLTIAVSGHSDIVGSDAANLKISKRCAESVVDYLAQRGIPRPRLVAKGYGRSRPVASNKTEEERKKNRRVEIEVLDI